jgi:alkylated DNA repair dioxygenase AlkB
MGLRCDRVLWLELWLESFILVSSDNLLTQLLALPEIKVVNYYDLFDRPEDNTKTSVEVLTLPDGKPMPDAEVIICRSFFDKSESHTLFQDLLNSIRWRQDKMKLYGKERDLPRLTAWYGDDGKSYTFSGIPMYPDAWTQTLLLIKQKIEETVEVKFNSVLLNLYRSGKDGIFWHSDDEKELGKNPVIASVSFGEARRFQMKPKFHKGLEKVEVNLTNGSLLIMKGSTQHCWQHQIPKTAKTIESRINLTFRVIQATK